MNKRKVALCYLFFLLTEWGFEFQQDFSAGFGGGG